MTRGALPLSGRRTSVLALVLVLVCASPALTAEPYLDAVGDALGAAPDIVAVEVTEPEGPVLSFSVRFAEAPPIEGDEQGSDLLWLALDSDPEVTFPELEGYSLSVLGSTLPTALVAGSHLLVAGEELYWHVVDVDVEGPVITFRLDRKLLGEPPTLYFRVYSAALSDTLYTEQVDHFPAPDEPAARYALSAEHE